MQVNSLLITHHALDRFRERFPGENPTRQYITDLVRESVKIASSEKNKVYSVNGNIKFVMHANANIHSYKLVTVQLIEHSTASGNRSSHSNSVEVLKEKILEVEQLLSYCNKYSEKKNTLEKQKKDLQKKLDDILSFRKNGRNIASINAAIARRKQLLGENWNAVVE